MGTEPNIADWIQAGCAAVGIVFTGILIWVSKRQSDIAEKQANIAEEQAKLMRMEIEKDEPKIVAIVEMLDFRESRLTFFNSGSRGALFSAVKEMSVVANSNPKPIRFEKDGVTTKTFGLALGPYEYATAKFDISQTAKLEINFASGAKDFIDFGEKMYGTFKISNL